MDTHRCKLCFRNFVSGKALGGHMRSHMMFLNAAKKSEKDQIFDEKSEKDGIFDEIYQVSDEFQSVSSYSSAPMSSSDEESEEEETQGMVMSHESIESLEKKSSSSVCKRSKRVRRSTGVNGFFQVKKMNLGVEEQGKSNEHSSLSSISENTPDEDVAHCLIMLSRDKWDFEKRVEVEFQEKDYYEEKVIKSSTITSSSKVRGKYKCETCNKLFKSYQALGGHRTSHKKVKAATRMVDADTDVVVVAAADEKKYECPFCDRVFKSGQAFGGHKRSHFVGAGAISSNRKVGAVTRVGHSFEIDLNMPAPVDEQCDYEISQVEISAVSDA